MEKYQLEVCVGTLRSACAARDGGAQRVELCSGLGEGGLTPSAGLIRQVVALGIPVQVLIRPRGGDFLYTPAEVSIMEYDVRQAVALGAHGVVIGALTREGDVDVDVCQRLVAAAQGHSVTFHRAFDVCRHPQQALEDIIRLGCDRILTSGQAANAMEGIPMLCQLVQWAQGRICIMPGCGVTADNGRHILQQTGAHEIHASLRHRVSSQMTYRHPGVSMGAAGSDEYSLLETSQQLVQALAQPDGVALL